MTHQRFGVIQTLLAHGGMVVGETDMQQGKLDTVTMVKAFDLLKPVDERIACLLDVARQCRSSRPALAGPAQVLMQWIDQIRAGKWLRHQIIGTGIECAAAPILLLDAGHNHHRQRTNTLIGSIADTVNQFDAVHLRHQQVGHHGADGLVAAHGLPGTASIFGHGHVEMLTQDTVPCEANQARIIGKQNPYRCDSLRSQILHGRSPTMPADMPLPIQYECQMHRINSRQLYEKIFF